MLFNYKATTKDGNPQSGSIEAPSLDMAISALQRRELIIIDVKPESKGGLFANITLFERVQTRDIVILSRQIATLFEAKVSVLSTFRLLASESSNPMLRRVLTAITDDVKGGTPISGAMAKHPKVFSEFYVNMIKSGEESGKLSETLNYLADYLDRSYALVSKAKNALIYPAFVIMSFVVVMVLMLTFVIPKLSQILEETGQELPIYTKIVVGISDVFVNYGLILLILVIVVVVFLVKYLPTQAGRLSWSKFQISLPYIGRLYRKLYLSRIADNLDTLITSGVSMVRSVEITSEVIGNEVFKNILVQTANEIKSGKAISEVFSNFEEVPSIMIQMIKVGEETGKLGFVLKTLAKFYQREVDNEVDTLVGLIEPAMIVMLGLAVGVLLTSVLVPIYNVASGF